MRPRTGPPPKAAEENGRPDKYYESLGRGYCIILRDENPSLRTAGPRPMDASDWCRAFSWPTLSTQNICMKEKEEVRAWR